MSNEMQFNQSNAAIFHEAVQCCRPGTLTPYTKEMYLKMRCFLNGTRTAGYALKDGVELVSVFNRGKKGIGARAVEDAIRRGAMRLVAYDGHLRGYYERFKFVVKRTEKNWSQGGPDIIFMELNKE